MGQKRETGKVLIYSGGRFRGFAYSSSCKSGRRDIREVGYLSKNLCVRGLQTSIANITKKLLERLPSDASNSKLF